jgi:predicted GNAT family acetyltransferase
MVQRRFLKTPIGELESLFQSAAGDRALLLEIANELKHRSTVRASRLAQKVSAALGDERDDASNFMRPQTRTETPEDAPIGPSTIETSDTGPHVGDRPSNPSGKAGSPERPVNDGPDVWPVEPFWFDEDEPTVPGPDSILAAWLTQEVLSPQALPDGREAGSIGRTLVRLQDSSEPWNERRFWRRGKERAVYWMVYLGELDLAKATESILQLYPDDVADERGDVRGSTTLAVVVLDGQGRPVEDKAFLSSFAWGYGAVRAGRLRQLAAFPKAERVIKAKLLEHLVRRDAEGNVVPLTRNDVARAVDWLVAMLNLPAEQVGWPGIAIRAPVWGSSSEAPEPELLNSFFIEDLVRSRKAFASGGPGKALATYLEALRVPARKDVVRDKALVAQTLAPLRTPLTRWPGPGRYPLVLMQQAAINHAVAELNSGGIAAINGPPGSGKTTLLRDIVAKVVLDRAVAMAEFAKPVDAFKHLATMRTGQANTHLYLLDNRLLGHEIVVASSNNKAVENISREIPAVGSIADDLAPPLRYFSSIADAVAAGKAPVQDGVSWGLAAAVLGNAANRSVFAQSFWWHKKRGMSRYLKSVLGVELDDDDDSDLDEQEATVLDVTAIEKPPLGEIEALERWSTARKRFLTKLREAENLRAQAQQCFEAANEQRATVNRVSDAQQALRLSETQLQEMTEREGMARKVVTAAAETERRAQEELAAIDRLRPGFFARLFGTRSYRVWRASMSSALKDKSDARAALAHAEGVRHSELLALDTARKQFQDSRRELLNAEAALARISSTIAMLRPLFGDTFADEGFWSQDDDRLQLLSPWTSPGDPCN